MVERRHEDNQRRAREGKDSHERDLATAFDGIFSPVYEQARASVDAYALDDPTVLRAASYFIALCEFYEEGEVDADAVLAEVPGLEMKVRSTQPWANRQEQAYKDEVAGRLPPCP